MTVLRNIRVPTGNILILQGSKGKLECLSLGDYGKEHNVKADFLGITKEIDGVNCKKIMPLTEKWIVTISTQYGCSMKCRFCDVPKVGPGINATVRDLVAQVDAAVKLHPEIKFTKRLNLHYARMGEPTFNQNVLAHAVRVKNDIRPYLGDSLVHPVVSTMLPKNNKFLKPFLEDWCYIKNHFFKGDAGLQFSINSTSNKERDWMFRGCSLSLEQISKIGEELPEPKGRKYAINIALNDNTVIDGKKMARLFSTSKFMCKITPIHETTASKKHRIQTSNGYDNYYPYKKTEDSLKEAGFDVLVFVPSLDEDFGRITCGNAILSGTKPECSYREF